MKIMKFPHCEALLALLFSEILSFKWAYFDQVQPVHFQISLDILIDNPIQFEWMDVGVSKEGGGLVCWNFLIKQTHAPFWLFVPIWCLKRQIFSVIATLSVKFKCVCSSVANYIFSDGSWAKFAWIKCECNFTVHHLHETKNSRMTIFPIFRHFEWKTSPFQCHFTRKHWNYVIQAWMGIHDIELRWNMIPWKATWIHYPRSKLLKKV